jgi:hypothetical protein
MPRALRSNSLTDNSSSIACICRLMALGAIRSEVAAFLIEPLSVPARKYRTAVDSIMLGPRLGLLKIAAGFG